MPLSGEGNDMQEVLDPILNDISNTPTPILKILGIELADLDFKGSCDILQGRIFKVIFEVPILICQVNPSENEIFACFSESIASENRSKKTCLDVLKKIHKFNNCYFTYVNIIIFSIRFQTI